MFQELIDKAHEKGIMIILDIVLNHTGNFGEQTLCKEFDRNTDLATQALINACMIPNEEKLGSDYLTSVPYEQYQRRLGLLKNVRGKNEDLIGGVSSATLCALLSGLVLDYVYFQPVGLL